MATATSTEILTPESRVAANSMLQVVNELQYGEYLDDPSVEANIGALILVAARVDLELTRPSIDYAIESYARHGLSREEFSAIIGDLRSLSPEEAEDKMRRTHLACEFANYSEGGFEKSINGHENGYQTKDPQKRVDSVRGLIEVIDDVETDLGESLDRDSLLELTDELRKFTLLTSRDQFAIAKLDTLNNVELLLRSSPDEISNFINVKKRIGDMDSLAFLNDGSIIKASDYYPEDIEEQS